MKAYAGSIVGVWVTTINGKPRIIIEAEDGKTYMAKCKEVWPGEKIAIENAKEE